MSIAYSVAITNGNSTEFLLEQRSGDLWIHHVPTKSAFNLGKLTKARIEQIKYNLDQLTCFADE